MLISVFPFLKNAIHFVFFSCKKNTSFNEKPFSKQYVSKNTQTVPFIIFSSIFLIFSAFSTISHAQNQQPLSKNSNINSNSNSNSKLNAFPAPSLGEQLSLACISCHNQASVHPIAGQNEAILFEKINRFATDQDQKTIMHQLVKGYNIQELKAIASYFAAQKPYAYTDAEKDFLALQKFEKNHLQNHSSKNKK